VIKSAREALAKRLSQVICEQGGPQQEAINVLAEKIVISPETITGWLSGERFPHRSLMPAIAQALQVNPVWLQTGGSNMRGDFRTSSISAAADLPGLARLKPRRKN
jgi:transcriptional regulator with XRE-family HTH domain